MITSWQLVMSQIWQNVFDKIRLTVAPLAYGAGIKGKVVESLAAGVPCICTSIAAEGLVLPETLKSYIADGAGALADAIHALHSNEAANNECARAGLDYIATEFSEERLDALMRQVIGSHHLPHAAPA